MDEPGIKIAKEFNFAQLIMMVEDGALLFVAAILVGAGIVGYMVLVGFVYLLAMASKFLE